MNNLYLDEMIKQASMSRQRSGPQRNPQPTPTAAPQPTPTAAGAAPTQPKLHPRVQALLDQAKLVGAELNKSPYTQAAVHMAKTTGKETYDHVKGRVKEVAKKTASRVEDRLAEEFSNHLSGGKTIQETVNGMADKLIDKATGTAKKEVVQDVAKSGMPMPLKVAGGLIAGGLGSYGAYKGYIGMNKEAAMSNLLEQGYDLDSALYIIKKAEENQADAQYRAMLRAHQANDNANYRGMAESAVGGLVGGGLGFAASHMLPAEAGSAGLAKHLRPMHSATGNLVAGGAMLGSLLGGYHGRQASLDSAARNGLGKEAAVVYALEQGYSLEQALYMLR